MPPDANWPNLPNYREFSPADHAAHRSPKGIPNPDYFTPGVATNKAARQLLKVARKPHLGQKAKPRPRPRRKKKER